MDKKRADILNLRVDRMFRFAYTMLCRYEEAQDAVQDVCERMWRKKPEICREEDTEAYWMKAVKNECIDRLRKKKEFSNEFPQIASEEDSRRTDDREIVARAISKLPERQKTVIYLKEIEGYTNRELAKMLNIEENQIRTILSRARKTMKSIIESENEKTIPRHQK